MDEELIAEITKAANGSGKTKHEVIGVIGGIAVLEAYSHAPFPDSPFTGAVKEGGGEWRRTSYYHTSADRALLHTLGYSHEGANSQFGEFASRMLNLP